MYRIGGLNILFTGWFPQPEEGDWLPMFQAQTTKPDIQIDIRLVPDIVYPAEAVPEWEKPYLRSCRIGSEVHRYYRRNMVQTGFDYAHLRYDLSSPNIRYLDVCDRGFKINEKQILACIGSEDLFSHFGRTVFHSSCVDIGGQALLFSGPSGIGKSTQAALWQTYCNAQIRNGDRTLLRSVDKTELACGLPYAGTSGICSSYELPIRAIVFLGQGKSNILRRLFSKEAARMLLTQFPVANWDAEAIGRAMDAAIRIASNIPIYHLICLPDQSATDLLKKTLSEDT